MRVPKLLPLGSPPAAWVLPFFAALLIMPGCTEQDNTSDPKVGAGSSTPPPSASPDSADLSARHSSPSTSNEQVSQYIRRLFQDRDGSIWFGTTSDGAVRYDPSAALGGSGQTLTYFNSTTGLGSDWVSSIVQDTQGHLWFGTRDGVSRFDGKRFTHYTTKDGLASDHVYCLTFDHKGWLWAATEDGVSCFDGKKFNAFPIPAADLSNHPYYEGPKRINSIIQDKSKNIWFATNGGGAYRYDGKTLTNFTTKEGLCDNFVQTILEDRSGGLWFGTLHGGMCKYDDQTFSSFGREQLKGDDVNGLYQDSNGTIWIGVTRVGLCSYDGRSFHCFNEKDGAGIRVIFCALEDAQGQLWFGTGAGVYRLEGGAFVNWTRNDALGSGAH